MTKAFLTFLGALLIVTAVTSPVFAEDKKEAEKTEEVAKKAPKEEKAAPEIKAEPSNRYAPEFCDFEATFPDTPLETRRCNKVEGKEQCYNLTSYTMVYDHMTTVDVSVTCVPSTPQKYDRYNESLINTALKGMSNRTELNDFDIQTQEREGVRHGTLIGTGKRGKQDTIYNAQLWVGQNSVMTVEAKLVGSAHTRADTVYGDILRSIHEKGQKQSNDALNKIISDVQEEPKAE